MSFQAYLDNIEEKTGRTPNELIAEAKKKKLTESKEIIAWLKKDYELGLGHAKALDYVIRRGPHFEVRQKSGSHRDSSGTLKLDGKSRNNRSNNSKEGDIPKLGAPAERALAGAGIKNLRQLSRFSETEIRQLHGIGPNALGKLHQALTDMGLSFVDKNSK